MAAELAFLFPGQGSQTPGMGRDLADDAATRPYFERAAEAVDGLQEVMFEGPADRLSQTRYAQVALLTVGVAASEALKRRGVAPTVCAGHSLGEFTALVCAGALTFEDGLALVELRGRCMSESVPEGAMAAVMGLDPEAIEAALPEGAQVANYNGPQQTIISGSREAVAAAEGALKAAGAKRVMPLPVSGPFHSPLMREAAARFREAVMTAALEAPACAFVSSVSGERVEDAEAIRALLADQITSPVRWTSVMQTLGPVAALEVGPGRVLQGISKRMDGGPVVRSAGTVADIEAVCAGSA